MVVCYSISIYLSIYLSISHSISLHSPKPYITIILAFQQQKEIIDSLFLSSPFLPLYYYYSLISISCYCRVIGSYFFCLEIIPLCLMLAVLKTAGDKRRLSRGVIASTINASSTTPLLKTQHLYHNIYIYLRNKNTIFYIFSTPSCISPIYLSIYLCPPIYFSLYQKKHHIFCTCQVIIKRTCIIHNCNKKDIPIWNSNQYLHAER